MNTRETDDQLVFATVAQLAFKKGFNWKTKEGYVTSDLEDSHRFDEHENWLDSMYLSDHYLRNLKTKVLVPRPTQTQLRKWLREVKGMHLSAYPTGYMIWRVDFYTSDEKYTLVYPNSTCEEAIEDALLHFLKEL